MGWIWHWMEVSVCLCSTAYILIGPRGGRALTGNAHAGALFAAAAIVTLKIVEPELTAVTVFSLHVFLREREREGVTREGDGEESCSKVYGLPSNWRYAHRACYCSANVVKIMMTGLERWAQSARQYLCPFECVSARTLHTQGVTHGSALMLPSTLQLQRWQDG